MGRRARKGLCYSSHIRSIRPPPRTQRRVGGGALFGCWEKETNGEEEKSAGSASIQQRSGGIQKSQPEFSRVLGEGGSGRGSSNEISCADICSDPKLSTRRQRMPAASPGCASEHLGVCLKHLNLWNQSCCKAPQQITHLVPPPTKFSHHRRSSSLVVWRCRPMLPRPFQCFPSLTLPPPAILRPLIPSGLIYSFLNIYASIQAL